MTRDNDHIRAVEKARGTTQAGSELPKLVAQVRDNALSILLSYLDQLFASCDDLFFDLSSRAANNNEQNLYFESMRELRIKKNGIITQYRQLVEQLFSDAANNKTRPNKPAASTTARDDGLSLVQHDEIEQDVAINSMVSKARVNNQEALYQLHVRLDYLMANTSIDAANNPLDPQQLCKSFAEACELLDINIKAKIILYKQFERLVVSRLANLYSNANDLLVNAGIIPRVSRQLNKTGAKSRPQADKAEANAVADAFEASSIQFDELAQLLATMRSLGVNALPTYQVYSANPGPVMTNYELLAAITLLQQQFNSASSELYIHRLMQEVLSQSNPEMPNSVKQTDEDTINLVAMFFEFVLGDSNLPSAIQAQISRLQIPILKVALKDQSFFNNSNHPARKLVNRLAEISIGLDDGEALKEDDTYQLVTSIAQDIHDNYAVDSAVFARKLEQLEQFAARSGRRVDLIEKRTNQAEAGKAKTEQARKTTQALLWDMLSDARLPNDIFEFLVTHWQQLLTLIHLKHSDDSPQWVDAVQLVQDLIWACQPQADSKSQERLEKIQQHLLARVKSGLDAITVTEDQTAEITASIAESIARCQMDDKGLSRQSMSHEHARALGHTPGAGTKSWKEMSALERQQSRHNKLTYEYIKKAEELPLNSWLAYEDLGSGQVQRCKLSARISAGEQYIFVNRLGFKVLKKSRKDFAYDMQKGRARPLQSEPLFDRAMARIRSKLASDGSQSSPA